MVVGWNRREHSFQLFLYKLKKTHYIITLGQKPSFPALCNNVRTLQYPSKIPHVITTSEKMRVGVDKIANWGKLTLLAASARRADMRFPSGAYL